MQKTDEHIKQGQQTMKNIIKINNSSASFKEKRHSLSDKKLVKRVVTNDKVEKIKLTAAEHKKKAMQKIRVRGRTHRTRLQLRLVKRRKTLLAKGVNQTLTKVHPETLSSDSTTAATLAIKHMIKTEKRLFSLIKLVSSRALVYPLKLSYEDFKTLCTTVLNKQQQIVLTPTLLLKLWEDAKLHRTFGNEEEIGEDTLNSWLQFGSNLDLVTDLPTNIEDKELLQEITCGLMTTQSFHEKHSNECEATRVVLSAAVTTKKRYKGLLKLLHIDESETQLTKQLFKLLIRKICNNIKELKSMSDSLLEALWEDVKIKCQCESNVVVNQQILMEWFDFTKKKKQKESI